MTTTRDHSSLAIRPDGVAFLSIGNGTALNLLNPPTIAELTSTIAELARRDDIRALVLSGAGQRACFGGADMRHMAQVDGPGGHAFLTQLHDLCEAVRRFPVPVVARVFGHCIGGGMELAAACDLRIAADDAKFSMPEVRIGIPSVIHAALFNTLIGTGNTRWMLLSGATVGAKEIARWGFLNRVVPVAELDAAVEAALVEILACDAAAVRVQKTLLAHWDSPHLLQAARDSIDTIAACFATGQPQALMQAFFARKQA